jgi:hypothetical protein
MGYSYQDIKTDVEVIKDKLDFIMKSFTMTKTYHMPNLGLEGGYKTVKEAVTLAQLYRELKGLGAEIVGEITEEAKEGHSAAPGATLIDGGNPTPSQAEESA